jgi:hypothetical protein
MDMAIFAEEVGPFSRSMVSFSTTASIVAD